jgi:hypothetical protein
MTFGVQFTNTGNVVTLDSEFARLSVICSGRYAPTEESNLGSTTNFPVVITTQEPPLVFVRPDTTTLQSGLTLMRVNGSPGAWTGFYVRAQNASTAQPNGRYFAAAFKAQATAAYGMRLWDASGALIFDSGTSSALFTRAFQNWTYDHTVTVSPNFFNYYTVSFDFPANEYMMINNFGMNLTAGGSSGRLLSCLWDFSAGKLWALTVAASNPFAFYLPALFAKMNV